MDTVHEFFIAELNDIYGAEKRLLEVLREAEDSADRGDLKRAFSRHRKQTEGHVKRLDAVFRSLDESPEEKTCEGLEGLVEEKSATEDEGLSPELKDLNLALAGVKIERYESSAYDGLITMAQKMGHREAVTQLKENLREEQETAKLLLELLKASRLDWKAGMAEGKEEGSESEAASPRRRRAA